MTSTGHFQSHYIPSTEQEQAEMLATLGLTSIDQLFQDIPAEFRNPPLDLPEPMSELEIQRELAALAGRNRTLSSGPSFLGAGAYHHFIPAVVKALMTRGEFLTAYTPYQPEVSQGTLQVIYEFQTLISSLYGMEVANAGMYDGATSLAEGVLMACRVTRRQRVAVADTLSPAYLQVIRTYCQAQGIELCTVSPAADIASKIDEATACLVAQYPNFYGYIEDLAQMSAAAHDRGALLVLSTDPMAMGMFQPPGHYDARHCYRRGPAPGHSGQLWRPLCGSLCRQGAIHPANAQPSGGPHRGYRGPYRLCVDLADPGAAYPPGASHQQHLHQ